MLINERIRQPYWSFLYGEFVKQNDPAKMRIRLEQLESAIFERQQELDGMPESYSHTERLAIEAACRKLLEIKTNVLGFPPIDVDKRRPQGTHQVTTRWTPRRDVH